MNTCHSSRALRLWFDHDADVQRLERLCGLPALFIPFVVYVNELDRTQILALRERFERVLGGRYFADDPALSLEVLDDNLSKYALFRKGSHKYYPTPCIGVAYKPETGCLRIHHTHPNTPRLGKTESVGYTVYAHDQIQAMLDAIESNPDMQAQLARCVAGEQPMPPQRPPLPRERPAT